MDYGGLSAAYRELGNRYWVLATGTPNGLVPAASRSSARCLFLALSGWNEDRGGAGFAGGLTFVFLNVWSLVNSPLS